MGTIQTLSEMVIHWRAPVFPGDTIRLVLDVLEVDENPSKRSGAVRFATRVLNQEDKVVCDGEWQMRVLRRDAPRARGRPQARACSGDQA